MGFDRREVPAFQVAISSGMKPGNLADIDIRDDAPADLQVKCKKPRAVSWAHVHQCIGVEKL